VSDAKAAAAKVRADSDRELSAATQRRDSINAQLANVRQMLATLTGGTTVAVADPFEQEKGQKKTSAKADDTTGDTTGDDVPQADAANEGAVDAADAGDEAGDAQDAGQAVGQAATKKGVGGAS
jgi:hypothetical protein